MKSSDDVVLSDKDAHSADVSGKDVHGTGVSCAVPTWVARAC